MNCSTGGTILLSAYVGFIIATLFTDVIADTVGNKAVILLAGALLTIGILGYSLFSAAAGLILSMPVIGSSLILGSILFITWVMPDVNSLCRKQKTFDPNADMVAELPFHSW